MMHALFIAIVTFVSAEALQVTDPPPARAEKRSSVDVPESEIEAEIVDLESRLDQALTRRDRKALEPLVAETFAWIHGSDGRVDARDVWLQNASAGMALSGQRQLRSEHAATLAVPSSHTAVRSVRVRLRDEIRKRETWMRQTRVFARRADGAWQLAWGQGTLMYEGPLLDAALPGRYAGTYEIGPGRVLLLEYEDGALMATLPSGARAQIFLASPTEEAVRTVGAGALHFELDPKGRPMIAKLVRDGNEIWRATRKERHD